jgi:predicted enzyme related to lactoylglutathione lyase
MNHTVCHFEIPADDPEKLLEFYTKLFGWTSSAWGAGEGETYWMLETGPEGEAVNGGLMKRRHPGQTPMNYISVESADEYAAKAQGLGATVLVPRTEVPDMGWLAVLQDPQGNTIGLFEERTA